MKIIVMKEVKTKEKNKKKIKQNYFVYWMSRCEFSCFFFTFSVEVTTVKRTKGKRRKKK